MSARRKQGTAGVHLAWVTVSYRSVFLAIVAVCALGLFIMNLTLPEQAHKLMSKAGNAAFNLLHRAGIIADTPKTAPGPQQASFTMIDGSVRVKKANSNIWVNADYTLPLEKGDVVQTGPEGIAKVVFTDGTNYNIKQDSLIVVEENSTNAASQTQVAVQLTSGTVDLTTGTYQLGSRSEVKMAGARASFAPESSAMVRNDPRKDQHEILVKRGGGEVERGNEVVRLADYERVSFRQDSRQLVKTKEIGPPTLITPANMMPLFLTSGQTLDFSWTQVPNVSGYRIRISRNPYFSSTVYEKTVPVAQVKVEGLKEGAYYWAVQSMDAGGRESVESEKNRFTIIPKGKETVSVALELDPFVQHGHVIEVRGKTEPRARVMVNGQEVPIINNDGSFQFFTQPLPNGENVITVTAQNTKGGVHTAQKTVVIQ